MSVGAKVDCNIYKSTPGYVNHNWGSNTGGRGTGISWMAGTNTDFLAIGARMVLQDGVPLDWKDPWPSYHPVEDEYDASPTLDPVAVLTGEGQRTFDQTTGDLYVWCYGDDDPSTVIMESWKGITTGTRNRHCFKGSMRYTDIKGIKFKMFSSLFKSNLLEEYNYIIWEDNIFAYCWKHLFQDSTTNYNDQQTAPMVGWEVRNNIFYRPTRECIQIYGDEHIFEYNEFIEHAGSWAGGAAMASIINARHTNDVNIRYNYFNHIGNEWNAGSSVNYESDDTQRGVDNECEYTGGTIAYNFFGDTLGGVSIHIGRSGCRMHDITISYNVFAHNEGNQRFNAGEALRFSTPHVNLNINNNVFDDQVKDIFTHFHMSAGTIYLDGGMTNTIDIRDNIFSNSGDTVPSEVIAEAIIDRNIFYNNTGSSAGTNVLTGDPLFDTPTSNNYQITAGSSAIVGGDDIGVYNFGETVPVGTDWWNFPTYTHIP